MRFILIVEGDTEKRSIEGLIRKHLAEKTRKNIGVTAININGYGNFFRDLPQKVKKYLTGPDKEEIIAIAGLMDLYKTPYAREVNRSIRERILQGTQLFEDSVKQDRFRMFFAVHEYEAWLLSDVEKFDPAIKGRIASHARNPEEVNTDEPPSKYLKRIYSEYLHREYKKTVDGKVLMGRVDPQKVYEKCPNYRVMIDFFVSLV